MAWPGNVEVAAEPRLQHANVSPAEIIFKHFVCVVNPICKLPFGDYLDNPSMVILGVVYYWVYRTKLYEIV